MLLDCCTLPNVIDLSLINSKKKKLDITNFG